MTIFGRSAIIRVKKLVRGIGFLKKKESLRYFLIIVLAALATLVLVYYSFEYINHNELNFSKEDSFILFLIVLLFSFVIIAAVYLNYRCNCLINLVKELQEEMADMEDNLITTDSTQYYTIIGMLDNIARGQNNEKKSAVSSDQKMDGEK